MSAIGAGMITEIIFRVHVSVFLWREKNLGGGVAPPLGRRGLRAHERVYFVCRSVENLKKANLKTAKVLKNRQIAKKIDTWKLPPLQYAKFYLYK